MESPITYFVCFWLLSCSNTSVFSYLLYVCLFHCYILSTIWLHKYICPSFHERPSGSFLSLGLLSRIQLWTFYAFLSSRTYIVYTFSKRLAEGLDFQSEISADKLVMQVHTYNPSMQEAKAEDYNVIWGQPRSIVNSRHYWLHSKILPQKESRPIFTLQ